MRRLRSALGIGWQLSVGPERSQILGLARVVEFVVSEGPGDLVVVETHVKGLRELFKTPHGGVLTRDAGYIVLRSTFDGDELIDQEILVDKGRTPRPRVTSNCSARSCRRRSGSKAELHH